MVGSVIFLQSPSNAIVANLTKHLALGIDWGALRRKIFTPAHYAEKSTGIMREAIRFCGVCTHMYGAPCYGRGEMQVFVNYATKVRIKI